MKRVAKSCKQTTDKYLWSRVPRGESPAKTLGLDADTESTIQLYCTARRIFNDVLPQFQNDGARLLPFYKDVLAHRRQSWGELTDGEREALIGERFDPALPPPPGFSNFPYDPKRQVAATLREEPPPDPAKLPGSQWTAAAERYTAMALARYNNGWRRFDVNCASKKCLSIACRALYKQSKATRASEWTWDKTVEEAKRQAEESGEATIKVRKTPPQIARFDFWTKQIEEYDKNHAPFPLMTAMVSLLLSFA